VKLLLDSFVNPAKLVAADVFIHGGPTKATAGIIAANYFILSIFLV